jgi:5-methyltetrahydrofolate--homocysteine methyltransferase
MTRRLNIKVDDLLRLIADLREEEALNVAKNKLDAGEDPQKVLENARAAMEIVGKRFSEGEYFLPDLVYSGEILKEISELVLPKLRQTSPTGGHASKFIIGTVAGDIHDIGKDIVVFMLGVSGFEVYDLGIDVPAHKFVEKINETGAGMVGLSVFLTLAFDSMKETIEAIKNAGLRDKVKIMIGGGQVDDDVRRYTHADAFRPDAVSGVILAKAWAGLK